LRYTLIGQPLGQQLPPGSVAAACARKAKRPIVPVFLVPLALVVKRAGNLGPRIWQRRRPDLKIDEFSTHNIPVV